MIEKMSQREFAIKRSLFFLLTIFILYEYENFSIYTKEAIFLWEPYFLFKLFHLKLYSAQTIIVLHLFWILFGLMSALGLLSRLSMILFALLSFYLMGFDRGFNMNFRFCQLIIVSFILVCSPTVNFSLDNLIRTRWFNKKSSKPENSILYRWSIELIIFSNVMMLFCAGLSKLRIVGWDWVLDGYLYYYLEGTTYAYSHKYPSWVLDMKNFFLQFPPWIISTAGWVTLIAELLSPVLLFVKRLRILGLLFFICFFTGIYYIMLVRDVLYLIPLVPFWIPCGKIFLALRKNLWKKID